MLNGLWLNLVSGFIVMLVSGILYYRKPERKWLLILLVIGMLSFVTAGIRMLACRDRYIKNGGVVYMFKLMKLEWKKHQLSSYFKSVAICIIAIFVASKPYGMGNESRGRRALL